MSTDKPTVIPKESVIEYPIECRFATYVRSKSDYENDVHFVKEQIHDPVTGKLKPNLRKVTNFQRNFYVTKKGMQNHTSKKEWISLNDVNEFKSTQSKLQYSAAKALGKPYFKGSMRDLQESPFLYGTDISSTAILKQNYRNKWDVITPATNAVFDTETDVINGTEQIVMATVSFKERLITVIHADFVKGYTDVINRIHVLTQKYLSEVFETRKIKAEIVIVPTEIDIVKVSMAKAHEWMPDFLSVWNLPFDIKKIIAACDRAKVSIEDIMSDPSVHPDYRVFKFKEGPAKKITASGVVMSYKPAARWHSITCPASFCWIDAMCAYKAIRTGSPEEKSYSLDAILGKELKISKLKFQEADHIKDGLKWHQFMQSKYPLEYVVYNMFDCISMEMLDEKTLDLQLSLPMFSGSSDYANFNSQPKRFSDAMHHFCLLNNKVVGSTSGEMKEEEDSETIALSGHIVMLPSHLIADNGLRIIEENPQLASNIYSHVGDLDVAGSYPNGGCCFNICKETTKRELISIEGADDRTQRMNCLNLSAGITNAVEIATGLFNLPSFDVLLSEFSNV